MDMINKSYYRILTDTDNNFTTDQTFIRVNCTGHSFYSEEVRASTSRHDYYLIYLYQGELTVNQPAQTRRLLPGDMILFQPECNFDYVKPAGIDMEYYWVHFTGYGTTELLNQCDIETNRILTPGKHECICDKFLHLFESFLTRDKFLDVEAAQRLGALIISIGKYISGQIADEPQHSDKICKSISFIHDHISGEIKVSSLASIEHMSLSHYRAVFHQVMGLSPKEYITLSKLNYSCELMRQTELSIKEIAVLVGYDDPQYYNRIFKKYFGLTPSLYKGRKKSLHHLKK
ncbi:MAG: transcriptional regulator, AraC family [Herbinix sp.]|nr:transcriptional regulator, AraC family [Herbinix sp.]